MVPLTMRGFALHSREERRYALSPSHSSVQLGASSSSLLPAKKALNRSSNAHDARRRRRRANDDFLPPRPYETGAQSRENWHLGGPCCGLGDPILCATQILVQAIHWPQLWDLRRRPSRLDPAWHPGLFFQREERQAVRVSC
jgi:hypothetical protein